jgi:hypothetical protein
MRQAFPEGEHAEAADPVTLAYRFGFLCHHASEPPRHPLPPAWESRRCEDFVLTTHPETPVEIHGHPAGRVVLVGDAYSQTGESLAAIIGAMVWSDPWPALDRIGGRHAILLLARSELRAAHDAFGSRSVFYVPGRAAVASHARLLGAAYGLGLSPVVTQFLERPEYLSRPTRYLPGDLTTVENVLALAPNNFWDGVRTCRYWPARPRRATTLEDFLAAVRAYFDRFVPFVESRYRPVFGVTGGIDSRAAFAPFRGRFAGVTWTHHFAEAERPVVRELLGRLGIEHQFLRRRKDSGGPLVAAAFEASGGLRPGRVLTERIGEAYGRGHVFVRGYGGEILRGMPSYEKRMLDFSVHSMRRTYNSGIRKCSPSRDYNAVVDAAFEAFHDRAHYPGLERFGYRAVDHFYWEHRMGMWGAAMLNEMDPGLYALAGFNSRPLYEAAFGLPDSLRLSKDLLRAVVGMYDPALAAISHT